MRRIPVNSGTSASGSTALLMVSIPNIRMVKPSRMEATFFFFRSLENIIKITPITASTGAKDVGFKSCVTRLPPSIPVRLKIQEVTVVPILAPIMIPTA